MTEQDIEKLLGRDLSAMENNNFSLYLDITIERLSNLLSVNVIIPEVDSGTNEPIVETRIYAGRNGYKTLYTDPFTDLISVSIDGNTKTVTTAQWDNPMGSWKNVVCFDDEMDAEQVDVTAKFGYGNPLPSDLQLLIARGFDAILKENTDNPRVSTKRNEDYSVSYKDSVESSWQAFTMTNKGIIQKYSQAGLGVIEHGDWQKRPYRYGGGKALE